MLAPRPGPPLLLTRPALRYLFVNNDANTCLHAALWVAMFATADGVGELCWPRLLAVWPVLLTVGLLTLLSPAPTWLLFTRHSRNLNKVDFLCKPRCRRIRIFRIHLCTLSFTTRE
jgi:hypothetical protein